MTRREYKAGIPTTLAAAINSSVTTITIDAYTNWPTGADGNFWVTIDGGTAQEERVLCATHSSGSIAVTTRGVDGTTASSHAKGATIWPSWSATDADEANSHINATGYASYSKSVHGLGSGDGVVVGTDKTQVLTAKTLTSPILNTPTINNPTISGTITGAVVTSANIVDGTITGTDIASGTITAANILDGTIVNAEIGAAANIVDTKLATISTAGKVSNSATTATSANTPSTIVARNTSGNFTAGTVTADLNGNASTATALATARTINGVSFNGAANINTHVGGIGTTSASGNYSVEHNLGAIPSAVTVTMRTNGTTTGSPRIFYVTGISQSEFNVRALDTAGNQQAAAFYWIAVA
jgi:hypothetical protein